MYTDEHSLDDTSNKAKIYKQPQCNDSNMWGEGRSTLDKANITDRKQAKKHPRKWYADSSWQINIVLESMQVWASWNANSIHHQKM